MTEIEPTRKISSFKIDVKIIEYLNDSVGSFLLQHKVENITDMARGLMAVQLAYQEATKKEKKPSE